MLEFLARTSYFLVTHTDTHSHTQAGSVHWTSTVVVVFVGLWATNMYCMFKKKKTGASACRTELLLTPNVVTSGDLTHRTNSAQPQPSRRAELKLSHRHRVVAMTIDDAAQRRGRR